MPSQVITRDASMQESVLMSWCKRLLRAATVLSVSAKPGKSGPLFLGDLPTDGVFNEKIVNVIGSVGLKLNRRRPKLHFRAPAVVGTRH